MKITRGETQSRQVVLDIELDASDVEPYLDRAYRRVVTKVRVPGFRPGKAPRAIVESMLGKEHLLHEALESLVNDSVDKAVESEQIEPYLSPAVDITEIDPVSIKAVIALEPKVELGEYQNLHLEIETIPVGEDQLDQVLERLRDEQAIWEPVERPVQFGDLVNIDVEGIIEGKQFLNNNGIQYIPSMENELPLPGFSVGVEGAKKDDNLNFTVKVPEDHSDATIAGQDCRFQVTIHDIKEKHSPELDDEFAKGVGPGYESLEALKDFVLEDLTRAMEQQALNDLYERALQPLTESSTIEYPEMMIDREVDHMWQDQVRTLQMRRMDVDTYLQQIGKNEDVIKEELRPDAVQRLDRMLVLRQLSDEEKITVESDEIDESIQEMRSASGQDNSNEELERFYLSDSLRSSVESSIRTRKTLERLGDIVQNEAVGDVPSASDEPNKQQEEAGGTKVAEQS
ncbi:trigger factor [SAR202 cluster bacterium AD-804-J14_MRT_500m]|nr:trigger factor [SAR202 cluster bacterium AD-804-J14_MRT_500m]